MEEVLSGVLFTKRSDADDEALNVDGQVYPVRDPDGNITGYKVFGRAELTISEKLRVAAQVSPIQEGGTDASLRATLGDNIELAKGKRSGQDDIDYEQIIARIPGGSLSYQQRHGDQDFEGKELRGQYSLPIGGATASVHGGVSEEEKNIVPEQLQRFFQNLMMKQNTWNLGASVRGRIGKGVGSLNVNRTGGDIQPVNRVGAQYQMPIGRGEAVLSGGASRKRGDELDWNVGAQFRYPFPR